MEAVRKSAGVPQDDMEAVRKSAGVPQDDKKPTSPSSSATSAIVKLPRLYDEVMYYPDDAILNAPQGARRVSFNKRVSPFQTLLVHLARKHEPVTTTH